MPRASINDKQLIGLVNLADSTLGSEAIWATDEFFAPKERMLEPKEPVFHPNTYDDHGQWMDGWETRRRRDDGHDACVIRLAYPGVIRFVDLDTRHFTGNYPPGASIEATNDADPLATDATWTELLPATPLSGDEHNLFPIADGSSWQYLRLNLFPDGGIARFRAYGEIHPDWSAVGDDETIDLFAIENGGAAISCNDQHYGDICNLNRPGRARSRFRWRRRARARFPVRPPDRGRAR